MKDRPLSYWITVARMGFENDFHRLFDQLEISRAELAERLGVSPPYISKVLNGTAGNYKLETMAKWARAIGAILQIRLIKEGEEVVRVVDYETARALDDRHMVTESAKSETLRLQATVTNIADYAGTKKRSVSRAVSSDTSQETTIPVSPIGLGEVYG